MSELSKDEIKTILSIARKNGKDVDGDIIQFYINDNNEIAQVFEPSPDINLQGVRIKHDILPDGDVLTPKILASFCALYGIPNVGDLSDGYHTFNQLYYQRCVLFAALVNTFKELAWKSHKHEDGTECFGGGWFIVGVDTPEGSYTYHYENKDWDMFHCRELEVGKKWDGHTEEDVVRLLSLSDFKIWPVFMDYDLEKENEKIKAAKNKVNAKYGILSTEDKSLILPPADERARK
jgi:hypothetical protein